ncbi:MAG: hypothetical protein AAGA99_24835, partial [Actinomycetota bacterium]
MPGRRGLDRSALAPGPFPAVAARKDPCLMKSRTNRRPSPFVRVALALSMVLMAACGGDGGDQTEAADTGASGSASSASASEPSGSAGATAPAATQATPDDATHEPDAPPQFPTIQHHGGTTPVPRDPKN